MTAPPPRPAPGPAGEDAVPAGRARPQPGPRRDRSSPAHQLRRPRRAWRRRSAAMAAGKPGMRAQQGPGHSARAPGAGHRLSTARKGLPSTAAPPDGREDVGDPNPSCFRLQIQITVAINSGTLRCAPEAGTRFLKFQNIPEGKELKESESGPWVWSSPAAGAWRLA